LGKFGFLEVILYDLIYCNLVRQNCSELNNNDILSYSNREKSVLYWIILHNARIYRTALVKYIWLALCSQITRKI